MRDNMTLLCVSALLAGIAWAFWHYAGSDGFSALTTILLIVVAVDNLRLRKQLQAKKGAPSA